jgi:hypothetical protein
MKTLKLACAIALLSSTSGCFTTVLKSGKPANAARIENDRRWHHGVIWGVAELSGPYDLKTLCPNGWAEVKSETSFVNGLLDAITSGIYAPQSVTIRCSGEEAEQAEDEAAEAAADSSERSL